MSEFSHVPVMLRECLEGLKINPEGVYLDGTVGGAGHSSEIAARLAGGRLFCLDKDPEAVAAASQRLAGLENVSVIQGDFRDAPSLLEDCAGGLDGALLDLGVSSHQLDDSERGFSYSRDGALDMRMSRGGESAADLVNTLSERELETVFREYGEEPYARLIAKKIVARRKTGDILTTAQLSETVISALPASARRKEKHPARRVFQALRIAVNDELGALAEGLEGIFGLLKPGGRFCIITFHSLEDRAVKRFFGEKSRGCICPPDFPVCVCGRTPEATIITKKPIVPSQDELARNRRSRSAKLRVLEKTTLKQNIG